MPKCTYNPICNKQMYLNRTYNYASTYLNKGKTKKKKTPKSIKGRHRILDARSS